MLKSVSLKRKVRVYEVVAEQRMKRALGEEDVPRHEPRHRCDHPRLTPVQRRLGAKALRVSKDELRELLLERCCNSRCGLMIVDQLDDIIARRRHYHLIPHLLQRRAHLTAIVTKGYFVSLPAGALCSFLSTFLGSTACFLL